MGVGLQVEPGWEAFIGVGTFGRETAKSLLRRRELAPGLIAFLTVALLAADAGGYEPTSWGWSALALLVVAGVLLACGARRLAPLEWALPAFLSILAGWVWREVTSINRNSHPRSSLPTPSAAKRERDYTEPATARDICRRGGLSFLGGWIIR